MEKISQTIDENLKTINQISPIIKQSNCDSSSVEIFTVLELLTDFFQTFQLTNSQHSYLFGLFLAIQAQCISVFCSQGIYSLPELSHFWTFFVSEFLNQTNQLSYFDFTEYITQIQTILLPFVQNLQPTPNRQALFNLIKIFESGLNDYQANEQKPESKATTIFNLLHQFLSIKKQCFGYLNVSEKPPKDFINFFLTFEYSLSNYHHLLQIRELVQKVSENPMCFPIQQLSNTDTIRVFSEKCLQFLILEIQSIIEFSDESQRQTFYQVCSSIDNLIATSKLFMNQRIIEKWNAFLPLLRALSIAIDHKVESDDYEIIFNSFDQSLEYNFSRDEIFSLVSNGTPTDFKSLHRLYCLLILLKQKTDDQAMIPHIDNLVSLTSARLFHSKIIYDERNLNYIFQRLNEEPTGFQIVSYLKQSLLQLVRYQALPLPEINTPMWLIVSLIDSINLAEKTDWIKYIPTSDGIMHLLSFDKDHQSRIKEYLMISEEATAFVDHLFMEEFDISFLPSFYKFGERHIQLLQTTRPTLMRYSMIFEFFSLIDAIHEQFGLIVNKLRVDSNRLDSSAFLVTQIQKIMHNNLFRPYEEKLIAQAILPLLVYLLYNSDEADTFLHLFFQSCNNTFVPRCCDLLAECYNSFECFDNWRNSYPTLLNGAFQNLLMLFNSLFVENMVQPDFGPIKSVFYQIIEQNNPKLLNEFLDRFTVIEKYVVIGSMLRMIIKNICTFNVNFPLGQVDLFKVITQINFLRLIDKCVGKIINLPGAVIRSEKLDHLLEQLDSINKSNSTIKVIEFDLDSIVSEFDDIEIVNPPFIHNYFNCVCHFLLQQIDSSSVLYSSNTQKRQEFKEISTLLSQFAATNDHFKLNSALNKLKLMLTEDTTKPKCSIYLFNSTVQMFLDQIYPMHTLLLMKIYTKNIAPTGKDKNESKESLFASIINKIDALLTDKTVKQPVNSSLQTIKQKIEYMRLDHFDQKYETIKNSDPGEYSQLDRLTQIRNELLSELEFVQSAPFADDSVRQKSEENLKKLKVARSRITKQIQEQQRELNELTEQYEELQSCRNEQLSRVEHDESEEHNKMSILQFIINNDFNLMQFDQRVVHPHVVFLHDQLKDATIANAALTRELHNKKFRIERPQIPHSAISEIFNESRQGRNWLSNDATNAMSLRGSLKILEEQRNESFKELVDATYQNEQLRMKAVAMPKSSTTKLTSNSPSVNEYLAKLDKIASSAKIRKDYGTLQEEFAQTADKLFFTLEEEMKELRNQIQIRKKYGEDVKEVRIKNLEKLLKI